MNIFLFELWNDSTKTIKLLALDFYRVVEKKLHPFKLKLTHNVL